MSYRELTVWEKSVDLVIIIYQLTKSFPNEEKYGLTSQIRRAAVSVPANIAEGNARSHLKEYLQHLAIARGSLAEIETLLTIAVRLNYIQSDDGKKTWGMTQEVGKMLTGLTRSLKNNTNNT